MEIKDYNSISKTKSFLGDCMFAEIKIKMIALRFMDGCNDTKENKHITFINVMLHYKIYNNG